jgi:5'-phosphate synthase pdxT subunit
MGIKYLQELMCNAIISQDEVYSKDRVIVAVRQGNILATAFHPELTSDSRWLVIFVRASSCYLFHLSVVRVQTLNHACALLLGRHRLFLDMDKESQSRALSALSLSASSSEAGAVEKNKPLDLPIFE